MTLPPIHVAIGLGCDRGTPLTTVEQALAEALVLAGVEAHAVAALGTIEAKSDEAALLQLADKHGLPLRLFCAAELAVVDVPNPSQTVLAYMGTPSVSEAAAILAAGTDANGLMVEKHKLRGVDGKNATVSVARCANSVTPFIPFPERSL